MEDKDAYVWQRAQKSLERCDEGDTWYIEKV